jgi:Ca2+-binding EF-hand superfamily protein
MLSSEDGSRYKAGTALTVLDGTALGEDVKLSREELAQVKEAFKEYDYDGSGLIDKSEMRELLGDLKWGVDRNQLHDFMTNVFGNEVRALDFDMFMKLYKAVLAKQPTGVRKQQSNKEGQGSRRISVSDLRMLEADLRSLFNSMDEDKKGYLSILDMRCAMCLSGFPDLDGDNFETAVHEHMRVADTNKDGKVSFEEFIGYRNQIIDYCYSQVDAGNAEADEELAVFKFSD